ncbi:uncharacterized protein LOC117101186 [Anneissia japonica]|uniref:uncharacterized protein LOC117101186 n=1 Tax=Anneissia japonica TaxID=1529436 RepID=UPI00142552D2|nr:uncharacterized protein LOC117101186 [Anneissia japonica]
MKHYVDGHQRSRGTRAADRNRDPSTRRTNWKTIEKPLFEKRQMQELLTLQNNEEKRLRLSEDNNKCNKMRLVVGIVLGAVVTMIVLGLVALFYFLKRNDQDSKSRTSMEKPKTSIRKPSLPKRFVEESDPYDEIDDSEEGIYIDDDEIQPIREEHEINNLRPPPPIPKGIQPLRKRSEGIYETPMRPIEGLYLELE